MNAKTWANYLRRDGGCCHCGAVDVAVPNHRINRGMGGSKLLNKPSNIVALCSEMNGLIESDASQATRARAYGWKLESWQQPEFEPVYYPLEGRWYYLDDFYERAICLDPPN